jgi:hypothetical protein
MARQYPSLKEQLTDLIQTHDLSVVLETLSEVMHESADDDDEKFGKGQGEFLHEVATALYGFSQEVPL